MGICVFFPKMSVKIPPPFGPGDGGTPLHLWSDRDMPPSRVCFLTWQSLTGYEFLPKMTSKSLRGYIFWPLSLREGMYVDPSWTSKISLRVSIFVFSLFEGIYKWVLRLGAPPPTSIRNMCPRAFGIYCDPLNLHLLHFFLAQDDKPSTMLVWWNQSNWCTKRKCGYEESNKGLPNERYWTILARYSLKPICNAILGQNLVSFSWKIKK